MSSSKLQSCLELCWFIQAFLKPLLQNRKLMPFILAMVFHSWPSEQDSILLEIRNRNEESCLWSLIATTSLDLPVISLQVLPCSSLVCSLRLKMTGVSITPTRCTPWCLGYHWSLSLWLYKWLWTLPSSFLPSSGCQSWPHTKACHRLQDLTNSRHDPNPGIKKVITSTFISLRSKNWFPWPFLVS
jgi:hypothetical protein